MDVMIHCHFREFEIWVRKLVILARSLPICLIRAFYMESVQEDLMRYGLGAVAEIMSFCRKDLTASSCVEKNCCASDKDKSEAPESQIAALEKMCVAGYLYKVGDNFVPNQCIRGAHFALSIYNILGLPRNERNPDGGYWGSYFAEAYYELGKLGLVPEGEENQHAYNPPSQEFVDRVVNYCRNK